MCEAFLALFIVSATAFLIDMVRIWVRSLLKPDYSVNTAFMVIPLRRDSENIEITIRELLRKTADIDPDLKIYVWNIDGECEALTICRKLVEDIGGFEIVDNISADNL